MRNLLCWSKIYLFLLFFLANISNAIGQVPSADVDIISNVGADAPICREEALILKVCNTTFPDYVVNGENYGVIKTQFTINFLHGQNLEIIEPNGFVFEIPGNHKSNLSKQIEFFKLYGWQDEVQPFSEDDDGFSLEEFPCESFNIGYVRLNASSFTVNAVVTINAYTSEGIVYSHTVTESYSFPAVMPSSQTSISGNVSELHSVSGHFPNGIPLYTPLYAFDHPQDILIDGTLTINENYTFANGTSIQMAENAKIVIKAGKTLWLAAKVFGCGNKWNNIQIESGGKLIADRCCINNSTGGILVLDNATLSIKNSSFRDNDLCINQLFSKSNVTSAFNTFTGSFDENNYPESLVRVRSNATFFDSSSTYRNSKLGLTATGSKTNIKLVDCRFDDLKSANCKGIDMDGGILTLRRCHFGKIKSGIGNAIAVDVHNYCSLDMRNCTTNDVGNPYINGISAKLDNLSDIAVAIYNARSVILENNRLNSVNRSVSLQGSYTILNLAILNNHCFSTGTCLYIADNNLNGGDIVGNYLNSYQSCLLLNNKSSNYLTIDHNIATSLAPSTSLDNGSSFTFDITNIYNSTIRKNLIDNIGIDQNSTLFTSYNNCNGLRINNGSSNEVNCNTINSYTDDGGGNVDIGQTATGIGFKMVAATEVLGNVVNSGRAFSVEGVNSMNDEMFKGNSFKLVQQWPILIAENIGIHYDINALVGTQLHRGNFFPKNPNITSNDLQQARPQFDNDDPLVVRSNRYETDPTIDPLYQPDNYNPVGWFQVTPSNGNNFGLDMVQRLCGGFEPIGPRVVSELDSVFILGRPINVPYPSESHWIGQRQILRYYQTHTNYGNNGMLQQFIANQQNQPIGQLQLVEQTSAPSVNVVSSINLIYDEIKSLNGQVSNLDAQIHATNDLEQKLFLLSNRADLLGNLEIKLNDFENSYLSILSLGEQKRLAAKLLNDNIVPTNIMEQNEKSVNGLYLENLALNLPLDAQKFHALTNIANQCAFSGGEAVLTARSIYYILTDSMPFIDKDICNYSAPRENQKNSERPSDGLYIMPNPASDRVECTWAAGLGVQCIQIVDVLGHAVKTINVGSEQTKLVLELADQKAGLYLIKASTAAMALPIVKKLIIVH